MTASVAGAAGRATFPDVVDAVRAHAWLTAADVALLNDAFDLAQDAHRGQTRRSGDPYITHPLVVALLLAQWGTDPVTVAVGLVHDVSDEGWHPVRRWRVRVQLGIQVLRAVDDVRALDESGGFDVLRHRCGGDRERLDRAVRVKLADRLHNARTWQYVPAAWARSRAQQTRSVMVDVAQRAGLPAVADELAALSAHTLASRWPDEPAAPSPRENEQLAWAGLGEARADDTAGRLLRRALLALPAVERPRYAQEWAADLAVTRGTAARLRLAIGMLHSARVLRRDREHAGCAVPGPGEWR